jgi:hypothetical protein
MLLKSSGSRRAFRGQKARYLKIEEQLLEYVSEKRQFGYVVSTEMCQCFSIGKRPGSRWFQGKPRMDYEVFFFTRNNFCIRRKTGVSQRLPDAYEEKILCFRKYVIILRRQHSNTASQIGNADQTPVYFEMPLDTTVRKKGDKNVTVRTGGNEKQLCMVMCITADGRKLPQYIMLKRKTLPKMNVKGVIIQAQESSWEDQVLVLDWINRVWQKRPGALLNPHSMRILGSFPGHTTEEVKKILRSRNMDQVVILWD